MSLASQISALATRVGQEFKAVRAEMATISGGGGSGAVSSVNAKTGAVVLTSDDIGDGVTKVMMTAAERTALASKVTGFVDPNVDRIVFWDDSASKYDALAVSVPLSITNTTMSIAAATTTVVGSTQYATPAQAVTGTSAALAVTPAALKGQQVGVTTLVDAATIAMTATAAPNYRVTIAGDRIMGVPASATDGQRILIAVTASGADRILTLTTGVAGSFKFGTDITGIPVIVNGTTTYIGCIYSSAATRWHVLAVASGY